MARAKAIQIDADEPKRVPPSDRVTQIRLMRSNGMPAEETQDTIGRLWAWGFLDNAFEEGGQAWDADLLREAGRRYAAAYWGRYGMVCARVSPYEEMTGRSASGPARCVIADKALDELADDRFRRRDEALRAVGCKREVDEICVDGAGDNDPGWLIDLMNGYPSATRELQVATISAEQALALAVGDKAKEAAERKVQDTRRALLREIRSLKQDRVPHRMVAKIKIGLMALAREDRADGFHKPRRGRPKAE